MEDEFQPLIKKLESEDGSPNLNPLLKNQLISPKKLFFVSGTAFALVLGISSLGSTSSASRSNLSENAHVNDITIEVSKPNVFLFTVDDMGWNDVGYNSNDLSQATPFINELIKDSIKLTQYYTQPSCTPSRVTMMTGKFAHKNGFQNYELNPTDNIGVPLSNKMMPEYMRELGYKTIGFGKWNIGHCNEKYLPSARGFDHFLGYLCPGHGYVDHNCGNGREIRDMIEDWAIIKDDVSTHKWQDGSQYHGTYDTLIYRDRSTVALQEHFKDSGVSTPPMFMWLAQHGIHGEYDSDPIPPASLMTSENLDFLKVLKKRLNEVGSKEDGYAKFFKMRMITASVLMSIDNTFKHFINTLESLEQLDNSVIFFNSDNGGDVLFLKGHPGNNYPLRSWKFSYYEGGIRTPAFVYAPGLMPDSRKGGTYDGMMHHVDLIATFVHLGGGDTKSLAVEHDDVDSLSQWDAIIENSASPRNELVLNLPRSKEWKHGSTATAEAVALRVGDFKILIYNAYDGWFSSTPPKDFTLDPDEMYASKCATSFYTGGKAGCVYSNYLFNVMTDPNERTNLWDDDNYADVRENLISRAEELVANVVNDYGRIVPEYYNSVSSDDVAYKHFKANQEYVVPFECEAIP